MAHLCHEKSRILWFIAVLCVILPPVRAENNLSKTIAIVTDGQPAAEIMIGPSGGAAIRHAAETLQKEFQRRTGACLPIIISPSASNMTSIYLGTLNHDEELNVVLAKLGEHAVLPDKPGRGGFRLLTGNINVEGTVIVNGSADVRGFDFRL